jgi:hypothetical protein
LFHKKRLERERERKATKKFNGKKIKIENANGKLKEYI